MLVYRDLDSKEQLVRLITGGKSQVEAQKMRSWLHRLGNGTSPFLPAKGLWSSQTAALVAGHTRRIERVLVQHQERCVREGSEL